MKETAPTEHPASPKASPPKRVVEAEVAFDESYTEPESGCPECGGAWRGAVEGPFRVCMDCGLPEQM